MLTLQVRSESAGPEKSLRIFLCNQVWSCSRRDARSIYHMCNTAPAVIPTPEACRSTLSTSVTCLAVGSWVDILGFRDVFYPGRKQTPVFNSCSK